MSASPDEAPASPESLVEQAGRRARVAAPTVAALSTSVKNGALHDIAEGLLDEADRILQANEEDVRQAERGRLPEPVIDRLTLTRPRLGAIAESVREVGALPDPVGEVLRGSRRPNGLIVQEVRVPIGVVGLIYESRPNITVDAISLCLKAGNAVVLRGGADAHASNLAIMETVRRAMARHGIPDGAIQLIDSTHPRATERMMHLTEYLDVLIPRGSSELIRSVCGNATVATIEAGSGNCHTFVERTARFDMAADIAFNAKVQRPGVVNSMETLLIDRPIAEQFLPIIGPRMQAAGVELRGCEQTRAILPGVKPATEEDWYREYEDLILAVRVVDNLDLAIAHIARYGSHNSEAIVTQDYSAAKRFCERVDAAAVYVNASTRFTDGFELGLGAELGVSTQKLHRRGPIGLRALTTWKWIVYGEGQVRD
ncbi:MAG TPA: glutamate-5-semialdehyde dehydrogenase [Armatimonadota bacterium]|nr:glutamate-5-semialdehyde dehydrogenase [Armatimonadota bacterium]